MKPVQPSLWAVVSKLEWAAGGEWSASVKPEECRLLLDELRRPPSRRRLNRPRVAK